VRVRHLFECHDVRPIVPTPTPCLALVRSSAHGFISVTERAILGAPDDTHEDEDDVVIVRHSPAPRDSEGPSAPTEVLERPSLSSTPSVSTSSRSPRSVMVLDAALAIFCTTGSQVQPAVRNRAQEILAKELFKNEARQIEIALVLFKSPTTCAHNRDLAQTVLVDHIDRFA
jgi:hypothetical protein